MRYCYFNGSCLEEANASLPIHTLGVQRGFGVFDLFRTRNVAPTFFEDHLTRFEKSQRFLDLKQLITRDEVESATRALQEKNQYLDSTFKLMLLGSGSEAEEQLVPFFYIANTPLEVDKMPKTGNLITHEYVREFPEIKSINYFTSNMLHRKKHAAGAIDVLYHTNGIISEASRSNIFVVKNGSISTPEKNILAGITRKHILKIAERDFRIEVRDVSMDEVMTADEVFISSTLKEVMPILKIDDQEIGDGSGPITSKLSSQFHEYLKRVY